MGYCYFVAEERKGLIGDLYVMKDFLGVENEELLLNAVVERADEDAADPADRIQLMMLRTGPAIALPQRRNMFGNFVRNFMEIELRRHAFAPERHPSQPVWFDSWAERKQEEAATLIATAYRGHIDSEINDQYRSPAGARRFLMNIVQFPGCGSFFQPASFVAVDPGRGGWAASAWQPGAGRRGHVTQVCVSKAARGTGAGYELIRRSLEVAGQAWMPQSDAHGDGVQPEAIGLYERMGFRKTRNFSRTSGTPSSSFRVLR